MSHTEDACPDLSPVTLWSRARREARWWAMRALRALTGRRHSHAETVMGDTSDEALLIDLAGAAATAIGWAYSDQASRERIPAMMGTLSEAEIDDFGRVLAAAMAEASNGPVWPDRREARRFATGIWLRLHRPDLLQFDGLPSPDEPDRGASRDDLVRLLADAVWRGMARAVTIFAHDVAAMRIATLPCSALADARAELRAALAGVDLGHVGEVPSLRRNTCGRWLRRRRPDLLSPVGLPGAAP